MENTAFDKLLKDFQEIESAPVTEKSKKSAMDIMAKAETNAELNFRQKTAIVDRCKNYIASQYGNTKTAEHLSQGKPSSAKTSDK